MYAATNKQILKRIAINELRQKIRRDKIEEHIVEFMNEMKHEDKDLLIEAA